MRAKSAVFLVALVSLGTLAAATQTVAAIFAYQPALGRPILRIGDDALYWPWSVIAWSSRWADAFPKPFAAAHLILLAGFFSSIAVIAFARSSRKALPPFGVGAWATFEDAEAAGLFAPHGSVLGKLDGEMLVFDGPEHQILLGASRSGKGRGHVVPTLLSWPGSALVLDVKGELDAGDRRHGFPGTSGFRATFGHVVRFAPTRLDSNSFNPLLEVRKGANEVRDIQNIVDIIVEPNGESKGAEQFWNNTAKNILTGLIVHVLYAEPAPRKTLAVVREKLADLDKTAEEMRATLHRLDPATGEPQTHPEVLHAAQSYLAGEERLRSGIKATAESFFNMFADPIVAAKTARSDFRLGDLMCADKPVTLYLQPPPSDAQRLMPLMRLFINQAARSLMEDQTHDGQGREKKHRLLLMLDEFPQLGRLDFFEKAMGAAAGYGVKVYLVCQSLNHITRAYGRENVILDNCHIVTSFAAADPETAKRIADMAGEVWEIRPHQSEYRPRPLLGPRKGLISYREERRPLMLPADVRKLRSGEQLIFVSGCKPLKAEKLRFDCERVFARRLLPPANSTAALTQAHDWTHATALGKRAPVRKPLASTGAMRGSRPLRPKAPQPAQTDLFAEAGAPAPSARPTPKISELALAGFAGRPHPSEVQAGERVEDRPPEERRTRGTGI